MAHTIFTSQIMSNKSYIQTGGGAETEAREVIDQRLRNQ